MLLRFVMLPMLTVAVWACTTNVPLSDFDTSCAHDADCAIIFVGDSCGCICGGNAAINVDDLTAYNDEFEARRSHCQSKAVCECGGTLDGGPSAVCQQGRCAFVP
jgi:hypothetical protein